MARSCCLLIISLGTLISATCRAATVEWNSIALYDGVSNTTRVFNDGSYLQETYYFAHGPAPMWFVVEMRYQQSGDPYRTTGVISPGWEQDQLVDFTSAWVKADVGDVVNREYIENARIYFFRTVIYGYDGFDTLYIDADFGEPLYLAWAGATQSDPYNATFGWMALTLDDAGRLKILNSAWDVDGDPIVVGELPIPEPSGALLLLLGGALLMARRKRGNMV